MKVLHLVPQQTPSSGIIRQAVAEQLAAKITDIDWEVVMFTTEPVSVRANSPSLLEVTSRSSAVKSKFLFILEKLQHRRLLYRWLRSNQDNYDVILLRHTYSDPIRFLKIKRMSTPVLSVHHTLEVPELSLDKSFFGRVRTYLERIFGPVNISASAGIVGVTNEIVNYELDRSRTNLPTFMFPNGIDLETQEVFEDRRGSVPELLFVASYFYPWHGLDLLLNSLGQNQDDFRLHLVGKLPESLVDLADRDERVIVHGILTPSEIAELAATAWLGLSSFALYRKQMKEACTLKVREYLAGGLPTYAGHRDVFSVTDRFFVFGPPDITQILKTAVEMRNFSREEIRTCSSPHISKSTLLANLYGELASHFASQISKQ